MNNRISLTKHTYIQEKLNDLGFRLILIPFFGIAIPVVTKMADHSMFSHWELKLSYAYTILISFLIWQGNRYLLFTLRSYFNWFNKPLKKIMALLLAISFYTIPVSTILLVGWFYLFAKGIVNWDIVYTSTLIIMICVIFIVHVYETIFLVRDSESEMFRNEQLERARAEAALEALKNQIDPHFIFNSLNTLSHLIEEKPEKARLFNDNLADVYRYILHNKGNDLVLLREEMEFLHNYFSLLQIRFEAAVKLDVNIDELDFEQVLIPPTSLQTLVENAIKHNEFSDKIPLTISIKLRNTQLTVRNQIHQKQLPGSSSNTGLRNLNERYILTTGKNITIGKTGNEFIVSLPVVNIS